MNYRNFALVDSHVIRLQNMKIAELLNQSGTAFSFEILPPLKGKGIDNLIHTIEKLKEFSPIYINITNHRSEPVYTDAGNGLLTRTMVKRRPGTVALAAMMQERFQIPIVPHILCSGFSKYDTEYLLIDLKILGIENLLLLRGDKGREDRSFVAMEGGYSHATELQAQVNRFNEGFFLDGSSICHSDRVFSYGVACYPEKHEEAPNLHSDLHWFKAKVEAGAEYGVTQMFFDNNKYFDFVAQCRSLGIQVPIVPGIKPITRRSQLTLLPKCFHCDLPEALTEELLHCQSDEEIRAVGIEWCIDQCKELKKAGVPNIHFYSNGQWPDIYEVAKAIY